MQGEHFVSARPHTAQQGFTLIEAIVALVLISTTGMALFAWVNTNLMTLNRIEAIDAQNEATLNVLDYMNSVNPMLAPDGKIDLGKYQLRWHAEPDTGIRDGASYPFGVSLYQLALYQTKVLVSKPDGDPWFDLELQQVGYKKVRELKLPFQ